MESLGRVLGASHGAMLRSLEAILESPGDWPLLGRYEDALGALLAALGAIWRRSEDTLGRSGKLWDDPGRSGDVLGRFGDALGSGDALGR